ncbi:MAG TPA: membrane protein insertion efficiency factor YidD [Actinospica sp.]|nr:membrane protein insertion efficiency factor YidD [Actinospica sp.]
MKYVFMGLIRIYQRLISPLLGPRCRYYPSCSHYGYEAMSVHGAAKGTILTAWRILRCNPWSAGGIDEVPSRGRWRWTPAGQDDGAEHGTGNDAVSVDEWT